LGTPFHPSFPVHWMRTEAADACASAIVLHSLGGSDSSVRAEGAGSRARLDPRQV